MQKILQFEQNQGLLIEVVELQVSDSGRTQVSNVTTNAIIKINDNIQDIIGDGIKPIINAITNSLSEIKPNEVEVKFGFSITGEANFIIPKISSEASFEITLKWNKND
jgi:hypothetical protein